MIREALICLILLIIATGVGYIFRMYHLLNTNVVLIYMVCVLLAASMTDGFVYGIITAILAIGSYNYFFVEPRYSLDVDNPSYVTAMTSMLFAAVLTSMLTSKSKLNERKAKARESETSSMLKLTNQVAEAYSVEKIAEHIIIYVSSVLKCEIACILAGDNAKLPDRFLRLTEQGELVWAPLPEKEELEAVFHLMGRASYSDSAHYREWPIYGHAGLLGILRIPLAEAKKMEQAQMKLFFSARETARLALERLNALQQQLRDNAVIEKERYRSTLLRSISHDLRTPLTGILGTSEMLLDMTPEEPKRKLIEDIYKDAQWLREISENVLSLTKLNDGGLIHKEPEACEEVIGTAVRRIQNRAAQRCIQVFVPEDCLVVLMDVRLIEQVLVNMLDNAVKHTREDGTICILAEEQEEQAVFEVRDNGEGLSEDDIPYLFQLFYTTKGENTDRQKGTGLGLAICEAIVKAHGGSIDARNGENGWGAIFRFTIPIKEETAKQVWEKDAE